MPLLIDLKPGEKVIINGAVIENAGSNTKIRICNDSTLLRQKEIMVEEDAVTPASRVYFCLQNAYIFPGRRDQYLSLFDQYLGDFLGAIPSAREIGEQMRAEVAEGHYYKALKGARKLLKHEDNIVRAMQGQVED
ncbi:MAG: flagellar biosynthesis repressor FlbT [Magnetospirillum sp.]|nr:flagellar biosynthesis repressor FlbT [Magnetospirillum sp.]